MTPAPPLDTTISNTSGSTLTLRVTGLSPGAVAVMVAVPVAAASTLNDTSVSPCMTSMDAGTSIAPELLLSRVTRTPPAPAGAGKLTAMVDTSPCTTCAGSPLMPNAGGAGGLAMVSDRLSTELRLPGSRTVTSST